MPPSKSQAPTVVGKRGEVLRFRSPAEFFSENKNIAGFDNVGKSLYTTVRELVENSLDACESIRELPDIEVTLQELDKAELNKLIGVITHKRLDADLYMDEKEKKKVSKAAATAAAMAAAAPEGGGSLDGGAGANEAGAGVKGRPAKGEALYYRVTVRDNGCGMKHENIPDMLGRVLSGSKYGVRQTRGKFGLGAKMALIWSKQSTGMPVEVRSATAASGQLSVCCLDIDIQKNEPRVRLLEKVTNTDGMRGTEISLVVGGSWSAYRAYIVRYMRQMAVITPYARFVMSVATRNDSRALSLEYARRSDEMPKPAETIKHHPAALNVELLGALLRQSRERNLHKFLSKDLCCVNAPLAGRLLAEARIEPDTVPADMPDKTVVTLAQLLSEAHFPAPPSSCLSPVGEYNMRLGILKELRPELVATFQDSACTIEGHPMIVEAGVCLGGSEAKPGITVYRFANRIPLLFEGGGDVATQVSKRRINWGAYKIRQNQDKIGVFISVVSTKVPFKGTGKEYIGDDIPEVQAAVKRAIERCCLQLKVKLVKQRALADEKERKKNMTRYIPDVCRALHSMLATMVTEDGAASSASKRRAWESDHLEILEEVKRKRLKVETLDEKLRSHVEQCDASSALEVQTSAEQAVRTVYLAPLHDKLPLLPHFHHPLFVFQLHKGALKEPLVEMG